MSKPSQLYSTKLRAIGSADKLCEIARPLIRAKARRMSLKPGFSTSDREDIEQEAYLRLLGRYEGSKESNLPVLAFIRRIVDQALVNLLRDRQAKKRDQQSVASLNANQTAGEISKELGSTISQEHLDARLGRQSLSAQAWIELGLDLEDSLANLSREQQELCAALSVHSISEAARLLNRPRTTIQEQVTKLRQKYEDSELRHYVK